MFTTTPLSMCIAVMHAAGYLLNYASIHHSNMQLLLLYWPIFLTCILGMWHKICQPIQVKDTLKLYISVPSQEIRTHHSRTLPETMKLMILRQLMLMKGENLLSIGLLPTLLTYLQDLMIPTHHILTFRPSLRSHVLLFLKVTFIKKFLLNTYLVEDVLFVAFAVLSLLASMSCMQLRKMIHCLQ